MLVYIWNADFPRIPTTKEKKNVLCELFERIFGGRYNDWHFKEYLLRKSFYARGLIATEEWPFL